MLDDAFRSSPANTEAQEAIASATGRRQGAFKCLRPKPQIAAPCGAFQEISYGCRFGIAPNDAYSGAERQKPSIAR
jgi:hypothetical protein